MEYGGSHGPSPWGLEVWFGWEGFCLACMWWSWKQWLLLLLLLLLLPRFPGTEPLLSGPLWMSPGFSEPPQRPLDPGMG